MINSQLYNSKTLWSWSSPSWLDQDIFVFNGYSMHKSDGSVRIRNSNHDDLWSIDLNTFDLPREDGGGVLWHYYRSKTIEFSVTLKSETSAWLNELIDDFKRNTRETEWRLEIKIDGIIRRATASITSLKFNRQYFNITFCTDINISFQTMDPHRQLKDYTSITYNNKTATFQEEITNNGSEDTYCKYYFIFNSGTSSLWSLAITIKWYILQVTWPFDTNDILIIDGENKTVTLNWVDIDYTWIFQKLEVGSNPVYFTFTGWTVDVDVTNIYTKKYR